LGGRDGGALPRRRYANSTNDALSHEEISIDDVIRKSALPPSAASVALLSLEMKRLIRQLPGKLFVRNQ